MSKFFVYLGIGFVRKYWWVLAILALVVVLIVRFA